MLKSVLDSRPQIHPLQQSFLPAPIRRPSTPASHLSHANPNSGELSRLDGSFIGFIGLNVPSFDAPFTPCVEIGWRLAADCWGQGLATEGAHAIVRYGFETLGLNEFVSFTVPANARSRRVMEKLGMTHDPDDDFDHPRLPAGHPLRGHVLYRLNRSGWSSGFVNK